MAHSAIIILHLALVTADNLLLAYRSLNHNSMIHEAYKDCCRCRNSGTS